MCKDLHFWSLVKNVHYAQYGNSLIHTNTCIHTHLHTWTELKKKVTFFHLRGPTVPRLSQQQVHSSFSALFLFRTLKEPLYAGKFAAEGFFCLLSLAPTATTMSSTLSCWYGTSPSPRPPLKHLFGGLLADVSKNIMPWALAKLTASSWLTWPSVLRGSRRSLLFPTRNLGGDSGKGQMKEYDIRKAIQSQDDQTGTACDD